MSPEEENERNDGFLNNMNSTLFIKKDYDEKEFNYEWLDIIEDVNPYIDNIFIMYQFICSASNGNPYTLYLGNPILILRQLK